MKKGVFGIVFSKVLGFFMFLLFLFVADYLTKYIKFSFYIQIVNFLVDNLYLSFIIMLATLFSELLWNFDFPLNLAAPVVSAFAGVFILEYIYRLWLLVEIFTGTDTWIPKETIFLGVFVAIIVFGYLAILIKIPKKTGEVSKTKETKAPELKQKSSVGWSQVGGEFRKVFYNFGRAINRIFESEPKKPVKPLGKKKA